MQLKTLKNKTRARHGQSLIETMCAFFVLIPLGLVAIDLVAFVSSTQQNEQLAELAARAAATQFDLSGARKAAEDAVEHFQTTAVMTSVTIDEVKFDLGSGTCSVATLMDVRLPVPFPFFKGANCRASSLQPIVSTPAPG
jgi:Tfp pilus assembly protein PilV